MPHRAQEISAKVHAVEPVGYTVSGGLVTMPTWVEKIQEMQPVFEFAGVVVGLMVGVATLYYTVYRINVLKKSQERK